MELKARLRKDLTAAMKQRDALTRDTLRMALTAVGEAEVAGAEVRELGDDEVLTIITREAKKRREAAEAFDTGGATDRADRERAEGEVLARYLPQQLSDEELTAMVDEVVAEQEASGPRAMGAVMKAVGPKVAGRAEGGRVAAAVRQALGA